MTTNNMADVDILFLCQSGGIRGWCGGCFALSVINTPVTVVVREVARVDVLIL